MVKNIKYTFPAILLLCLVVGLTMTASATNSGTWVENLTWMLDDEGTLTISDAEDMANYTEEPEKPWTGNEVYIKQNVINEGIACIFANVCSSMTLVSSILKSSSKNQVIH